MKQIVVASGNRGKIREIKELLGEYEIIPFKDILGNLDIVEDGDSFAKNAEIKAKTIYDMLDNPDMIVISDDSGISIDALDGEPGIFSARYAKKGASDLENLNKVIDKLKKIDIDYSKAHYTCAVTIASKNGLQTVHGWMYGRVGAVPKGDKGFGYDPIFYPEGFDKTLGELDSSIKDKISHRAKALELAKLLI